MELSVIMKGCDKVEPPTKKRPHAPCSKKAALGVRNKQDALSFASHLLFSLFPWAREKSVKGGSVSSRMWGKPSLGEGVESPIEKQGGSARRGGDPREGRRYHLYLYLNAWEIDSFIPFFDIVIHLLTP